MKWLALSSLGVGLLIYLGQRWIARRRNRPVTRLDALRGLTPKPKPKPDVWVDERLKVLRRVAEFTGVRHSGPFKR